MVFFPDSFRLFIHIRSFKILIFRKIQAFSGRATVAFLTFIHRHYASSQFLRIRFSPGFLIYFSCEREDVKMNPNDKKDIEAYAALIAGLERENKIQGRLIEAQAAMIKSLEEHNAELERIISDLSSV